MTSESTSNNVTNDVPNNAANNATNNATNDATNNAISVSTSSEPTEREPSWRAFAASGVGLEMGIYVVLGFFFGRWLDGELGTDPAMMMVFVLVGVTAGIISMVRASRAAWGVGPASKQTPSQTPEPGVTR